MPGTLHSLNVSPDGRTAYLALWEGGLLLADVVIFMRQSAPLVAAFHPVLAVSLFGVTSFLAVRSWQLARQSAAAAAPKAAALQVETSLS